MASPRRRCGTRPPGRLSDQEISREESGAKGRYVLRQNGAEAELTYSIASPKLVIADHTGVQEEMRGTGAGRRLVVLPAHREDRSAPERRRTRRAKSGSGPLRGCLSMRGLQPLRTGYVAAWHRRQCCYAASGSLRTHRAPFDLPSSSRPTTRRWRCGRLPRRMNQAASPHVSAAVSLSLAPP